MDTLYACDTYWFIPEEFRLTESSAVEDRFEVYERMPRADEVYADLLRQVVFATHLLGAPGRTTHQPDRHRYTVGIRGQRSL